MSATQGPPGADGVIGADGKDITDAPYIRLEPTPVNVGGITAGSTFEGTLVEVLDRLFYPYQSPQFTSFSFAQSSPLEVGQEVPQGDKTYVWETSNSGNVEPDTITITGPAGILGQEMPNSGSATIHTRAVSRDEPDVATWTISLMNTNGQGASRNFSITWLSRIYFGESADPLLSAPDALRASELHSNGSKTYTMLGGGYKYIAYPVSFGLKTQFKDPATGFGVSMQPASVVSVTNAYGITQDYYLHRTTNQLGGAINIAVS